MATDYDQRRGGGEDSEDESLQALKASAAPDKARAGVPDVDEAELAESLELPGADLSGEELSVRVTPKQRDEFTCTRCFLVHHQSQRAGDADVCRDCA